MTVLIILGVLLPALGFGSFYLQRRRTRASSTTTPKRPGRATGALARAETRRLGYRYADDRIFISGTGVFAGVVLGTATDEFATADEHADIALRPAMIYRDLLGMFKGSRVECHEMVRYRPITTHGWLRQLLDHAWHPTRLYQVLAGKAADHIATSTPQRLWTLIVRLGDFPVRAADDPLSAATAAITGVTEERFSPADLAPWHTQADYLHDTLGRHGAEPLTRRDLLWLIRKPGHGHLPVPDAPTRRRPWRGGFFELAATLRGTNLGGGFIRLQQRDMETGRDRTSYTATLVVVDQAPRQVFTARAAWSRRIARLPTPAEVSWRYTLIPGTEWKRLCERAVANIDDEQKDRIKAGAEEDLRFDNRLREADQLRQAMADDQPPPGMIGRLRLTVSAPTEAALARAVRDVKAAMGEIEVEVPAHAQLPLLAEQLPGEADVLTLGSLSAGIAGGMRLWSRHSDTYMPSMGMLGSHNQVGDRIQVERGRPLGWIGVPVGYVLANGSVVHYDPQAQVSRNHGAGIAVLGASGGGKSSFAFLMFFWLSESGVRCSVLDPKIDFANFVYYICFGPQVLHPDFMTDADRGILGTPQSRFQPVNRQFWDDTSIVDLARGHRGSQDPWRITSTFGEGLALATNLTDALFTDTDHRRIVKAALRAMNAAHKAAELDPTRTPSPVGYADVADHIRDERAELEADYQAARAAGGDTSSLRATRDIYDEVINRLDNADVPFLRLIMGRGSDHAPQDHSLGKRRIIYTLAGFKTPDHPDDPTLWTDEDRNASAAMLAVLFRMRRDNLSGRMRPNPVTGAMGIPPTAAFIDEANMVTAIPAGRAYMVVNLRQGRSLSSVLFFIAQQSRDPQRIEEESVKAGATEVNQFGTVAMFRQKSKAEALAALSLLRSSGDGVPQAELDGLARKLQSADAGGLLQPGDCVLRDPDSRVAAITVDQMFYVIQRAAQTNPDLKPLDWAHPVPTDPEQWEINPEALLRVRTQANAAADHTDHDQDLTGSPDGDVDEFAGDWHDTDSRDDPSWTEPSHGASV